MNALGCFQKIEDQCSRLNFVDYEGEPVPGVIAVGRVVDYHSGAWEKNQDALIERQITVTDYFNKQMLLIDDYRKHLTMIRLQKMLNQKEVEK